MLETIHIASDVVNLLGAIASFVAVYMVWRMKRRGRDD